MKSITLACFLLSVANLAADSYQPRAGDVIFQSLERSPLIDAIEGATESPYSHCGIVLQKADGWYVLEALEPVRETPWRTWVAQGRGDAFDVYRLKPKYEEHIDAILAAARTHLGKPYDILYQFDDEKIYCSELIFKAFQKVTGEDLGKIQKLGDLKWEEYKAVIVSIDPSLPLDRPMITPRALAEAPQLTKVFTGILAANDSGKKAELAR